MYIKKIQNFICGYVCVIVEGFYIEKFINYCKKNEIYFENIKRKSSTMIEINIPVKEFKNIAKYARKNKCKIKIKNKKGIPFILHKYKKRKIFIITIFIILILFFILSQFLWNIEVIGNTSINSNEIIDIAKKEGLEQGKLKNKIDLKKVIEHIRLERSDISWVGIKIVGTNAIIEIVEADKAPKIIDENEYCNIVSTKDAMIVSVDAQNGTLQVKEGDIVKKGTVLIGGWIEGKYTGTRYVHANGKVMAKVWYTKKEKIYYKQKEKKKTGNIEKKYSININKFAINFYKTLSKFEIYDTICTEKKLKIFSNFYLPFKIVEKENYELINEEKAYNKDEAKQFGIDNISNELKSKIKNEKDIVNKYINTNESDEYIEVEIIYEVLENIGTEEKLAL